MEMCDTFWGTHGCDLPEGHDGPHDCDDHSQASPAFGRRDRLYETDDDAEVGVWSEWKPWQGVAIGDVQQDWPISA